MDNEPALRVLLVDDEMGALTVMRVMIERTLPHWEVKSAKDAAHALEILPQFYPHIMISDTRMPGMSGLELIAHLRNSAEFNYLYIILRCPHLNDIEVEQARLLGIVDEFWRDSLIAIYKENALLRINFTILGDYPHG